MFLLFTLLPALELYLLLQIGSVVGPASTVAVILLTGAVGAWMAKREGLSVLRKLQEEVQTGLPPGSRLTEAALVVAGGLLLVTPGVLTDLAGFAMIVPLTRPFLAKRLGAWLKTKFVTQSVGGGPGPSGGRGIHVDLGGPGRPKTSPDESPPPFDHPVR